MKGCSLNCCETPLCRIAEGVFFRINYQALQRHFKFKPFRRPFKVGVVCKLRVNCCL